MLVPPRWRRGVDQAIDRLAMWTEDRIRRDARGYRPGTPGPLRCFGPLSALVDDPPLSGRWSFASAAAGEPASVHVAPATSPRRGTALLVPPWKIRREGTVAGWSRLLARAGYDVWLYVPPHHLERAARGRSGEAFVSPDLDALRATVEQVVTELRTIVAAAARRGPVALVGLSLGAWMGALAATAPEPLDAAVLVAPPDVGVSLARTPIGDRYRSLARRAGAPIPADAALDDAVAPFSPALRHPTARRVLIAAGRHDVIVPPEAPLALARAWGVEPRMYARGHLTLLLACRQLRRDVVDFLSDHQGAAFDG